MPTFTEPEVVNDTRILPPYHVILLNDEDHTYQYQDYQKKENQKIRKLEELTKNSKEENSSKKKSTIK